jgi:hypothetical protein
MLLGFFFAEMKSTLPQGEEFPPGVSVHAHMPSDDSTWKLQTVYITVHYYCTLQYFCLAQAERAALRCEHHKGKDSSHVHTRRGVHTSPAQPWLDWARGLEGDRAMHPPTTTTTIHSHTPDCTDLYGQCPSPISMVPALKGQIVL